MKRIVIILLIIVATIGIYSCGTDNLKVDKAIPLRGPIQIKFSIDNTDSIIHQGYRLKFSYSIPTSLITADGVHLDSITQVKWQDAIDCTTIEGSNAFVRKENFEIGSPSTGKSRAFINIVKGQQYWEDTYVCRDTGVFWFSYVDQPVEFRFWTADGKEYTIPVTIGVDVQDRHTNMLLRYCPFIEPYLHVMLDKGFGYYCFKVVP